MKNNKKFYTIYKITNKINGKFYIGQHITEDLDDGYMGSGVLIKQAISKYGQENFLKEIILFCSSEQEMNEKERELVNEDLVKNKMCYNIALGGGGNFWHINSTRKNVYDGIGGLTTGRQNLVPFNITRERLIQEGKFDSYRKLLSETLKNMYADGTLTPTFLGRNHTEETKRLIGSKSAIHQKGERNSQYGKRWQWIHNDLTRETKKIPLSDPIPDGWEPGLTFDLHLIEQKKIEKQKLKEKELENKIDKYTKLHELYLEHGFKKFVKITGYDKSSQNLVQNFAKYVKEFDPKPGKRRGK